MTAPGGSDFLLWRRHDRNGAQLEVFALLSAQVRRVAIDRRDRATRIVCREVAAPPQAVVFELFLVGQIDARKVDRNDVIRWRRLADLIAEKENDTLHCSESDEFLPIGPNRIHSLRAAGQLLAEELRDTSSFHRDKRFGVGRLRVREAGQAHRQRGGEYDQRPMHRMLSLCIVVTRARNDALNI